MQCVEVWLLRRPREALPLAAERHGPLDGKALQWTGSREGSP